MATQPCTNIAQIVVELTHTTEKIQNTFYYEKTDGYAVGDILDLASEFDTAFLAEIMPNYSTDVSFSRIVVTDLSSLAGERVVVTPVAPIAGAEVSESAPAVVALSVQKLTGSRGRGQQGRVFVGPIPEAYLSLNQVTAAYAQRFIDGYTAIDTAIALWQPTCGPVVLSRYSNGVKRPIGIGLPILSYGTTNLLVDVQDNRLPQHKRRRTLVP